MNKLVTAIIRGEGDGFVAQCPELDFASQGRTIEEARENLREALILFFETALPAEISDRLKKEVYVKRLEIVLPPLEPQLGMAKAIDIARNRILADIYMAHNAIAVYVAISEHGTILRTSPFARTLGSMQIHALGTFILSICKIFESPSTQHPNYSIPTALNILNNYANDEEAGFTYCAKLDDFIRLEIDPGFSFSNANQERCKRTLLLDYFYERYPRKPLREKNDLDAALDGLKVQRDRRVAHNEDVEISSMTKVDLDGVSKLLAFAKTFVNIVGDGLLGFSNDGRAFAEDFAPQRSNIWTEVNELLTKL